MPWRGGGKEAAARPLLRGEATRTLRDEAATATSRKR